jgi:hypothetical protein
MCLCTDVASWSTAALLCAAHRRCDYSCEHGQQELLDREEERLVLEVIEVSHAEDKRRRDQLVQSEKDLTVSGYINASGVFSQV